MQIQVLGHRPPPLPRGHGRAALLHHHRVPAGVRAEQRLPHALPARWQILLLRGGEAGPASQLLRLRGGELLLYGVHRGQRGLLHPGHHFAGVHVHGEEDPPEERRAVQLEWHGQYGDLQGGEGGWRGQWISAAKLIHHSFIITQKSIIQQTFIYHNPHLSSHALSYDNQRGSSKLWLHPVGQHGRNPTDQLGRFLDLLVELTLARAIQIVLGDTSITLQGCPRASSDRMYFSGIANESSRPETMGRSLQQMASFSSASSWYLTGQMNPPSRTGSLRRWICVMANSLQRSSRMGLSSGVSSRSLASMKALRVKQTPCSWASCCRRSPTLQLMMSISVSPCCLAANLAEITPKTCWMAFRRTVRSSWEVQGFSPANLTSAREGKEARYLTLSVSGLFLVRRPRQDLRMYRAVWMYMTVFSPSWVLLGAYSLSSWGMPEQQEVPWPPRARRRVSIPSWTISLQRHLLKARLECVSCRREKSLLRMLAEFCSLPSLILFPPTHRAQYSAMRGRTLSCWLWQSMMVTSSFLPFLNCLRKRLYREAMRMGTEQALGRQQEMISRMCIIVPQLTRGSPFMVNSPSLLTCTYLLNRFVLGTRMLLRNMYPFSLAWKPSLGPMSPPRIPGIQSQFASFIWTRKGQTPLDFPLTIACAKTIAQLARIESSPGQYLAALKEGVLMTHSWVLGSKVAVVQRFLTSDPCPISVWAQQPTISQVRDFCKRAFWCSSVPMSSMYLMNMPTWADPGDWCGLARVPQITLTEGWKWSNSGWFWQKLQTMGRQEQVSLMSSSLLLLQMLGLYSWTGPASRTAFSWGQRAGVQRNSESFWMGRVCFALSVLRMDSMLMRYRSDYDVILVDISNPPTHQAVALKDKEKWEKILWECIAS